MDSLSVRPLPGPCLGRATLVADIVGLATTQHASSNHRACRCVVLHGLAGIGKSAVALAVLHDDTITGHFGPRRLFMAGSTLALKPHIRRDSSPSLIVIDNFDVLSPMPTSADLSWLMATIRRNKQAFFLITHRGRNVLNEPGIRAFEIGALDLSAATEAFAAHSSSPALCKASEPDVLDLVARLDRHPLAIALLARSFSPTDVTSVWKLLDKYEEQGTEILRHAAANDRYTCFDISLRLSLNPSLLSTAHARALCFFLSVFPGRPSIDAVDHFLRSCGATERGGKIARKALLGAGLAMETGGGAMHMPLPFRDYISATAEVDHECRRTSAQVIKVYACRPSGRLGPLTYLLHKQYPAAKLTRCDDDTLNSIIQASGEPSLTFEALEEMLQRRSDLYRTSFRAVDGSAEVIFSQGVHH